MARVWNIFRCKSDPFSAAVRKTEFGPPRLRSGSQMALTLVAIGLQTREICYPGRLAARIALWLTNCAYFRRNLPPNSRNKYAILADWPHELRCDLQMAPTLVATCLQTLRICYPGQLAARVALWLANCRYVGCNCPSSSRNALF